jgi:hypothetical protein
VKTADAHDPKGLIRESYRIEGITPAECRSIFLDWALSLPLGQDSAQAIAALLARHGEGQEDHPMTQVLREGQAGMTAPRRRGGWRSRTRN